MSQDIMIGFDGLAFKFGTDPSLFSPNQLDLGSRTLLEAVEIPENAKTILDLGFGWGAMGIIFAKLYPDRFVYLVDNDPRAIEITNKNLELNGIKNAKTFKADVTYSTLPWKADVIVTNPPWTKNKSVLPALIKFAHSHLHPIGKFYLVINRIFRTEDQMEKVFGNVAKTAEKSSYKILRSGKLK